ncbi:hypothetical protein OEG84_25215 [Hoeflea sp. G2-23]|uniref:Transposase n=1 Tax=Hoeflea algicola TaxID=2983763 RepID=A0ABT3ZGI6_9HYPH|nr:hypothetical protein [Hoeflea algicola]MCY0150909.1 hypothetical protein [Hoeflea algicola]
MKITDPINVRTAKLEAALARENQMIAAAIDAKQIGDGYWKKRWHIEQELRVVRSLRDVAREVWG